VTLDGSFGDIDAIFDRFQESGAAPGCAFGLIVDGALVHAGGRGSLRVGEAREPDPDSRFRIASMTKSFTAATILRLRDDGALRLDDEVATWVPELAGMPRWSADSPALTIRSLLTMSSGLPTDDPWGDRQQPLDAASFRSFLEAGPGLAWPPGTQFEYSNLGFAILGLVVARAASEPYRDAVQRRILEPLGLASTTYDAMGIDPDGLALGYVRRADEWIEEEMAGDGAFAPMGGLFSTVHDLARWVATFASAGPARDDPDAKVPLSRASLREMQQIHRAAPPELTWKAAAEPPMPFVFGYGFGLFVTLDVRRGRIVGHGGGYPGYGSHMRWHPASGIGVVALANGRYAPIADACRDVLNLLLDRDAAPSRRPAAWPATLEARASVERLLEEWDDDLAAQLFAMNVDLDEPIAARRAAIDKLREVHGRLRPDPSEPVVSWVQQFDLTSIPEAPAALSAIAERTAALLGRPGPSWPDDLRLAETVDRTSLDRALRAAEALFGPLVVGPVLSGDGVRTASWRLRGERGDLTLSLEIDPADGAIREVSLVPATLESPVHAG
jgi:CubicO group peptidase (beta-lactamase class C family)